MPSIEDIMKMAQEAQSKLAETIAKKNAPGYQVKNNLKASGGASPVMKKS